MKLAKIISGGQTGVDRAALDVALALGIPCGGWCPRGRRAEDGAIDLRYPLTDTPREEYPQRTEWNVRDSDGTLILTRGQPRGGTALTMSLARDSAKPYRVVDLSADPDAASIKKWAETQHIKVLNIAGPRESENPGIYTQAVEFLLRVFS